MESRQMNQIDHALLTAVKRKLLKKKADAVRIRVKFGDLTIVEAGTELKLYLDKLDTFRTLEDLDTWRNSRKQNPQS